MKSRPTAHGKPARPPEFFSAAVARARRFYLDLNPQPRKPLVVVCGGREHCTADYAVERRSFPFHSIEYVVRGGGEVMLKGRTHRLEPGLVFSYGPGIPHRIAGHAEDPPVKYFVDFAGRKAAALLQSCGLTAGRVSRVHPPPTLQPLFDELIESGLRTHREQSELCLDLLNCLVLKLRSARMPVEGPETLAFQTYQQCRQYMDRHFQSLRTLEQIAAECHVNGAYLCRLFQRYDQQSPYQYLLRLKMSRAAEQLQEPGCLVKQVAEASGFTDHFHFSRVFKRVLGVSPGAFRQLR